MSTRSTTNPEELLERDLEIERTILVARRVVRLTHRINTELDNELDSDCVHSVNLYDNVFYSTFDSLVVFTDSSSNFANSENMVEQEHHRNLKELATLNVVNQNMYIQYPELGANFELKSGLIHLFPNFHGLTGECPHKHL
ncbi:hypothetical protein K1719_010302 [Acacia pycnantha]|nr:hypothetical protein K1719_010302 [Acacia pycnantha]